MAVRDADGADGADDGNSELAFEAALAAADLCDAAWEPDGPTPSGSEASPEPWLDGADGLVAETARALRRPEPPRRRPVRPMVRAGVLMAVAAALVGFGFWLVFF